VDIYNDNWGFEGLNGDSFTCQAGHVGERKVYAGHVGERKVQRGLFTTKSTYSWLILKKMGMGPHRLFWKRIWKHKILLKIQVFAWRVGNEILPTNTKIATIRPTVNPACQRCGADKETLIHAIKDCPTARETLVCGGLDDKLVRNEFDSCID
ncbi:hypothetical protein Golax_010732, partial [Gossypium laxum]|nr:hypothetical protein [Gossypium laxum]